MAKGSKKCEPTPLNPVSVAVQLELVSAFACSSAAPFPCWDGSAGQWGLHSSSALCGATGSHAVLHVQQKESSAWQMENRNRIKKTRKGGRRYTLLGFCGIWMPIETNKQFLNRRGGLREMISPFIWQRSNYTNDICMEFVWKCFFSNEIWKV